MYNTRIYPVSNTAWPGQSDNQVGFVATPARPPTVFAGTWPGAYFGDKSGSGLTYRGPSSGNGGMYTYAQAVWSGAIPSGTPSNPTIVAFQDFDGSNIGTPVNGSGIFADASTPIHDIVFVGCRFQGCCSFNWNVEVGFQTFSYNVSFFYCSFTPTRFTSPYFSKVASPAVFDVLKPGSWPDSSVGTGYVVETGQDATYMCPYLSGSEFPISIGGFTANTNYKIDHCDIWGGSFGISVAQGSIANLVITDNWVHDFKMPDPPAWDNTFSYLSGAIVENGSNDTIYKCILNITTPGTDPSTDATHWQFVQFQGDHTNGIGNASGGKGNASVLIQHNTVAFLGNVYAISWQDATIAPKFYANISMIANYLSGSHKLFDLGSLAQSPNTGWCVSENVLATDVQWAAVLADHGTNPVQAQFTNTTNRWRNNKLKIYPGDTWSPMIWNSGTTYTVGAQAIDTFNYHMYQCLVGNTNVQPHTNGTDWLDLGLASGMFCHPIPDEFFSTVDWAK